MDTDSTSGDGSSNRHSLRERQPTELLKLSKKTGSAWTRSVSVAIHNVPAMNTMSDFSSFGRRLFSIPTIAANAHYWVSYGSCQGNEHTGTNCRVLGASIRRTHEACCHTQNGVTRRRLLVCFSRLKSVLASSHVQVLQSRFSKFNSQKRGELDLQLNEALWHRSNKARKCSTNRSQKMRSQARYVMYRISCYSYKWRQAGIPIGNFPRLIYVSLLAQNHAIIFNDSDLLFTRKMLSRGCSGHSARDNWSENFMCCKQTVHFPFIEPLQKQMSVPAHHANLEGAVKTWSVDTSVIVQLHTKESTARNVSTVLCTYY